MGVSAFDTCYRAAKDYSAAHQFIMFLNRRAERIGDEFYSGKAGGANEEEQRLLLSEYLEATELAVNAFALLEETREEYQQIRDECWEDLSANEQMIITKVIF